MKLEIGDAIVELEYTVNSVCDLEELRKQDIGSLLGKPGMTAVRDLLWAGLIENKVNTSIKEAGKLMQAYLKNHEISELLDVIVKAIEEAGFLGAQGKKPKK